jgi:hypothetical protein
MRNLKSIDRLNVLKTGIQVVLLVVCGSQEMYLFFWEGGELNCCFLSDREER